MKKIQRLFVTALTAVLMFVPFVSAGAYTVEKDLIGNGYPAGYTYSNDYVILHEAGNPNNVGPNSLDNEVAFMKRTWNTTAFVSYFVGSGGRVKQLAGNGAFQYGAGDYANGRSYAQIELSRTNNRARFEKDYKSYINLARNLAKKANIPLTLDGAGRGIKSHQWISLNFWGDHQDPYGYLASWGVTKAQVQKDLRSGLSTSTAKSDKKPSTTKPGTNTPLPEAGALKFHDEKATFTNGNQPIQVRKNQPGLSAPRAGVLAAGAKINYDGWVVKDGYTWVKYTGNTGDTLYLPVRYGSTAYGKFSATKKAAKPAKKPTKVSDFHAEKATFTNSNVAIQVRVGKAGLSAKRGGLLPAGAKIRYDGWTFKDGFTWIRYKGYTGDTLFLPVRQGATAYGSFK